MSRGGEFERTQGFTCHELELASRECFGGIDNLWNYGKYAFKLAGIEKLMNQDTCP